MSTNLPRPGLGGCILVLPTATRNIPGGPSYTIDQVGQRGIVVGFDVPVPQLTRDGTRIRGRDPVRRRTHPGLHPYGGRSRHERRRMAEQVEELSYDSPEESL
jgi:hypothetical protein